VSASAAVIARTARDGRFEVTVSKMECGISKIGDKYLNRTAQGQFCKVSVSVKNIGNEAKLFTDSNQYGFNTAGQKFEVVDSAASIYLGDDSKSFLENINPGNGVNGVIIFDIPEEGQDREAGVARQRMLRRRDRQRLSTVLMRAAPDGGHPRGRQRVRRRR